MSKVTSVSRRDGTLSHDQRFRWSAGWQKWIPTGFQPEVPLDPLESGPLLPERHSDSCLCDECWSAGVRYTDYLKARSTDGL
jgi:hypothetical protein